MSCQDIAYHNLCTTTILPTTLLLMDIFFNSFYLLNLSHKLYGILKSLQRSLGLEEVEIDDGSESLIREYGFFFLIFGILFLFIVYLSLNQRK